MKILFVHPALRSYRLELFEKLNQTYDMSFIFVLEEKENFDNTKIPNYWRHKNIFIVDNKNSLTNAKNWIKFIFELLGNKYDIIISSPAEAYHSLLILIISKIKCQKVILYGESWYWGSNRLIKKMYFSLVTILMKRSNAIIGSGEKSSNFYKNRLQSSNVFNAPNYIVLGKENSTNSIKTKLSKIDENIFNKKIILYLGRIIINKGLDYLIKAFKTLEDEIPNVFLLIGGDGTYTNECKELTRQLNVKNILFLGYVPTEETPELFDLCYVFVLPSIFYKGFPEPLGLVVCEAMSHGKPIIVTNAVGAAQYIQNGVNGFVVPEKNVEILHKRLHDILSDDELAKKMGNQSKIIFQEQLGAQKQYDAFKNVIEYVKNKN
jgi:glycosyltransferase involved in cell wall biosynthesis